MTSSCDQPNPANGQRCILGVNMHPAHYAADGSQWIHEAAIAAAKAGPIKLSDKASGRKRISEMAGKIAPVSTAGPIARTADPRNSHEAADLYQPHRDTAAARVLTYLQERVGQWVDAVELTAPEVGGFAGTRRMRDLRSAGHDIQTRRKPGSTTVWQHRLAP